MSAKLFVGNLNFSTTADSLQAAFAKFGTIKSLNLITDKFSGRSRGFAFIEFETEAEAQAAIEAMNNQPFEDRTIVVNVAKPQEERPAGARREFRPRTGGNNFGGGYDRQ